jgi:predicted RNase H-like HicB family nuclease
VADRIEAGYSEASGVTLMATFTAMEQGDDGSWSAYTLSPSLVIGTGETKDAALADLRTAMAFWLEFMKETGQPVSPTTTELVSFEVAA